MTHALAAAGKNTRSAVERKGEMPVGECICSSCKNLKYVVNEDRDQGEYICEFGFPSPACEDCQSEECGETCSNYRSDDEGDEPRIVHCKCCGKELQTVIDDDGESEVFCLDCYLNNQK